jgi:glycogen operon protein
MELSDWRNGNQQTLGMWIDGADVRSHPLGAATDSWLLVLHAAAHPIMFTLPGPEYGQRYEPVLDTASADGTPAHPRIRRPSTRMTIPSRTVLLFRAIRN